MKPVIGITQRVVENENYAETRDALAQDWTRFFKAVDMGFVALPNNIHAIQSLLPTIKFNGFVLSGGNDIGEAPMRDATEKFLLQFSIEQKTPVIGICRGMQMMQFFLGGDLLKIEHHIGTRHNLVCDGQARGVNSYHGMGFMKAAPGLQGIAYADDGSIEAVKHDVNKWLGLMWHPEREDHIHPQDIEFFKGMFGS